MTSQPQGVEPASVLLEAHGLVHGDRQGAYGHPADDFARTAALASAVLAGKLKEPLCATDVAAFMVCVKLSRQVNAPKRDNLVDLAGYAETWQMVLDRATEYVVVVDAALPATGDCAGIVKYYPGKEDVDALDTARAQRKEREPSLASRLSALGPPPSHASASGGPVFMRPFTFVPAGKDGALGGPHEEGYA